MVMGVVIKELGYLGIKLLIINDLYQFHYLNFKKKQLLEKFKELFFLHTLIAFILKSRLQQATPSPLQRSIK